MIVQAVHIITTGLENVNVLTQQPNNRPMVVPTHTHTHTLTHTHTHIYIYIYIAIVTICPLCTSRSPLSVVAEV
jgi:hypothetical protein